MPQVSPFKALGTVGTVFIQEVRCSQSPADRQPTVQLKNPILPGFSPDCRFSGRKFEPSPAGRPPGIPESSPVREHWMPPARTACGRPLAPHATSIAIQSAGDRWHGVYSGGPLLAVASRPAADSATEEPDFARVFTRLPVFGS